MFSLAKMMKPALGLLAGAALMTAATGLAAADETRVVFVTHGQSGDPYWSVVKNGMDDAAKTLGVKAEYLAPETFDMAKMAQMIDAAVASKPDGLVVSIPDACRARRAGQERGRRGHPGHRHRLRRLQADQGTRRPALHGPDRNMRPACMAGERIKASSASPRRSALNHEVGNSSLDDRCAGFAKGLGVDVPVLQGVMDPTEMKTRIARLSQRPSGHRVPARRRRHRRPSRRWPRSTSWALPAR